MGGQWKDGRGPVDVEVEAPERAVSVLRKTGYCYIGVHSSREYDPVLMCHRCLAFDHRVKKCRLRKEVCRRWGIWLRIVGMGLTAVIAKLTADHRTIDVDGVSCVRDEGEEGGIEALDD